MFESYVIIELFSLMDRQLKTSALKNVQCVDVFVGQNCFNELKCKHYIFWRVTAILMFKWISQVENKIYLIL